MKIQIFTNNHLMCKIIIGQIWVQAIQSTVLQAHYQPGRRCQPAQHEEIV